MALVQSDWGLELFDDMNCANNPVRISQRDDRLVFEWPKVVEYSDGAVHDAVTFTVLGVEGHKLSLRRDRDGVAATIIVAPDGRTLQYHEADPATGSSFDRCANASS